MDVLRNSELAGNCTKQTIQRRKVHHGQFDDFPFQMSLGRHAYDTTPARLWRFEWSIGNQELVTGWSARLSASEIGEGLFPRNGVPRFTGNTKRFRIIVQDCEKASFETHEWSTEPSRRSLHLTAPAETDKRGVQSSDPPDSEIF